jgi:hypothetical protein
MKTTLLALTENIKAMHRYDATIIWFAVCSPVALCIELIMLQGVSTQEFISIEVIMGVFVMLASMSVFWLSVVNTTIHDIDVVAQQADAERKEMQRRIHEREEFFKEFMQQACDELLTCQEQVNAATQESQLIKEHLRMSVHQLLSIQKILDAYTGAASHSPPFPSTPLPQTPQNRDSTTHNTNEVKNNQAMLIKLYMN